MFHETRDIYSLDSWEHLFELMTKNVKSQQEACFLPPETKSEIKSVTVQVFHLFEQRVFIGIRYYILHI